MNHRAQGRADVSLRRAIGAGLASLGLLLTLVTAGPATAQAPAKAPSSRPNDAEVRDKLQNSGLSPDQIREVARMRGVPDETIDQYVPAGGTSIRPPPALVTTPAAPPDSAAIASQPMAPARPAEPPEFTKEIAKRVRSAPTVLPFGYDIFGYAPTTFEPLAAGPVDLEYPIGPGDEVIVQVWGDNEFTQAAIVSREATITVPDIGQVVLNGLTLAQAKRLITDRLASVYSGIRARRPSTFVDVTLGKLRTIQVFILGDVVRPGGYTISSVSTVLNALYNAGGPTALGSMRDIRIIRHDGIFKRVDLYGYILTGSKAEDVRLQNGDVVFAPPIGRTAAIVGEVHRPAIYELLPGESFHELLRLAGGIQSTALLERVQIDRVIPFAQRDSLPGQDRVALDLPLKDVLANPANNPELVDRDIVQVFRVGDVRKNTVSIHGDVIRHPGTYQLRPDMKIHDLVELAGGYSREAYLERATLIRTHPDLTRSIHRFNLRMAVELVPDDDLGLQELDEIRIASVWEIRDRHNVSITGSVRKPGTYEYLDGMTLMDLIFQAGGLSEAANKLVAEIARVDSTTIATIQAARIIQAPISADYAVGSSDFSMPLQRWDQVSVRQVPDWQMQRNVTLMGEVLYPGTYALQAKDERLSSLISRAGGLKASAYPHAATFVRKKDSVGRLAVDFDAVIKHGNRKQDLVLEDGDAITIPREPQWVRVTGEVGFPGSVLYERGRPLDYYVEQSGGFTDRSDRGRVKLVQANGKVKTSARPDAGALIVVPGKPMDEKHETLKDIGMIVGIISGAATTIFLARAATK